MSSMDAWRRAHLAVLAVWMAMGVLRTLTDLVGRLWLAVAAGFLQILLCLIGTFALVQGRRSLLGVHLAGCIVSAAVNGLLVAWWIGELGEVTRPILSLGMPYSFSFWLYYTPRCHAEYDLERGFYKQSSCWLAYTRIEAAIAGIHGGMAIASLVLSIINSCRKPRPRPPPLPALRVSKTAAAHHHHSSNFPKRPYLQQGGSVHGGYANCSFVEDQRARPYSAMDHVYGQIMRQSAATISTAETDLSGGGGYRSISREEEAGAPAARRRGREELEAADRLYTAMLRRQGKSRSDVREDDELEDGSHFPRGRIASVSSPSDRESPRAPSEFRAGGGGGGGGGGDRPERSSRRFIRGGNEGRRSDHRYSPHGLAPAPPPVSSMRTSQRDHNKDAPADASLDASFVSRSEREMKTTSLISFDPKSAVPIQVHPHEEEDSQEDEQEEEEVLSVDDFVVRGPSRSEILRASQRVWAPGASEGGGGGLYGREHTTDPRLSPYGRGPPSADSAYGTASERRERVRDTTDHRLRLAGFDDAEEDDDFSIWNVDRMKEAGRRGSAGGVPLSHAPFPPGLRDQTRSAFQVRPEGGSLVGGHYHSIEELRLVGREEEREEGKKTSGPPPPPPPPAYPGQARINRSALLV